MTDADQMVQVVDCPNCDCFTVGEIDFPNPPTCDECGAEAEKATVTTKEDVAEHVPLQ